MRSIMLAIVAMAFATLAPFALAAEGQGDNAEKAPTMAELGNIAPGASRARLRPEVLSPYKRVDAPPPPWLARPYGDRCAFGLGRGACRTKGWSRWLVEATWQLGRTFNGW